MAVYVFPPGEHDEYVCGHILRGNPASGPVEHTYDADGSVTVDFPGVSEEAITSALSTYDRADYDRPLPIPGDILLAVFDALGKPAARALAREYPDAMLAIDHRNWAVLRESVDDMLEDEAVTPEQYAGIQQLLSSLGIPED